VEDATKALEATNGTTLEKNGQILRVAYAKSIFGPGSGPSGHSQSSSLAAAAIEAATFAQQVRTLLLLNENSSRLINGLGLGMKHEILTLKLVIFIMTALWSAAIFFPPFFPLVGCWWGTRTLDLPISVVPAA